MSVARGRMACASCTKRKVKCSKTVPCVHCIRRGEQDTCGIISNIESPVIEHTVSQYFPSSAAPLDHDEQLSALSRRVAELEAELQQKTYSTPEVASHRVRNLDTSINRETGGAELARDAVAEDAASILEFLAWGRRKNPEYHAVASPEAAVTTAQAGEVVANAQVEPSAADTGFLQDISHTSVLQLLLPDKQRTWDLVLWHERCLLWYHCSYYAPSLRKQLESFYSNHGGSVENPGVNLQWVAFLFAVLAGSLTCMPNNTAEQWGFGEDERETLSKRWFQAVISCLNKADYAANHSILSIQAIATLTVSAHMLGFSSTQSIHLAAAVRIAQSLGLHRLTSDASGSEVEKETGRRVWSQLCSQDWFSLPFSETYLVNPLYSKSELPMNCHDEEVLPLPDFVPTVTGYSRFLHSIASIMPRLQDGLVSSNTLFTKYEQVVKWDKQLRNLATAGRPIYLSAVPLDSQWPVFVPWARRSLAISSSHKIIMIHRSFLSESFTNPAFGFTRRTCLAASKTIIKEYKCVVEENGPVLWIHQAFSVAASVILILDVLHRENCEPESMEHLQLYEG
ncbi:hypothetical protein JX265_012337 [Neoarthrinium moseri]|uniref:Zn(2)-C6 fungal-type domain-containing protein n=1 Tax=Neoarthrinium moseri TaxID=1658444 RepID=A0A9P9WAS0_9PEZI|nr:hypothetical protein JX265_012337 [Neoarthrinium moseri]